MVVVASSGARAGSGSCFVGKGSRFSNLIHSASCSHMYIQRSYLNSRAIGL